MHFPLLNLLKEITVNLHPVLKELGLRPKIGRSGSSPNKALGAINAMIARDELGPSYQTDLVSISFQNKDGTRFSSLRLDFPRAAGGNASSAIWEGARLVNEDWSIYEVGTNWKFVERGRCDEYHSLESDLASNLETIERALRKSDIVFVPEKVNICTQNAQFAKAYDEIEIALSVHGNPPVTCIREAGVESFNFEGPDGMYKIAFEGDCVVLYVDGKRESSCPAKDHQGVGHLIGMRHFDLQCASLDLS